MLRYDRQTKPGLVALYDIRPGNGAGPFLQPRSPHGALNFLFLRLIYLWISNRSSWGFDDAKCMRMKEEYIAILSCIPAFR